MIRNVVLCKCTGAESNRIEGYLSMSSLLYLKCRRVELNVQDCGLNRSEGDLSMPLLYCSAEEILRAQFCINYRMHRVLSC